MLTKLIDIIIDIIINILSLFIKGTTIEKFHELLKKRKSRIIFFIFIIFVIILILIMIYISLISVTKVIISKDTLTINVGETHVLTATVLYSNNSTDNNVIWTSSNESIATIDKVGNINALSSGTTIITAQASKNNSTSFAECKLTVVSPPTGYSISVHQTQLDPRTYVINIIPYEDDVTKIELYCKSPYGEIYTLNKTEDNLYHFYYGTWTIYASIENSSGIYEASKPNDFVTIKVTNLVTAQSYIKDINTFQ